MKRLLPCFLIVACCMSLKAQTFSDVFDEKTEITWLGLDFSKTKVVGDRESWASREPVIMFEAWNQLMIKEAAKYNVAEALHKPQVKSALEITMDHNKGVSTSDLFADASSPEFKLSSDGIQNVVSSYNFKDHSGIGFIMIVESLDKISEQASIVVTFVNLKTKEVLFAKRMTNAPGGFGLRNYWASCVYEILKRIKNSEYKAWKRQYAPDKKK